ncbi:MAG TPA: P-loop NTPase, partial [Vicinamibacterales bacterium]|nr:P-loop NTPase [Vicinamibacterales bacterium]
SAGLFVPEGVPPRVTSRLLTATLLRHLVFEVAWEARVLVIDAPPGTGEEVQVIAGELPLSAAIVVTTPQDIAQMDAERTLALLGERGVTVIAAVKNMAWMTCPHCGERIDMYLGSTRLADAGVETIAELPFGTTVSELVDRGAPLVLADPRGVAAREFIRIARDVRSALDHL